MARLTLGQKSERVLQFLRGLSEPRVAAALMPFEWSTIARSVVKGRRQLRRLGFLASSESSEEPEAPPVSGITGEDDDETSVVVS